jgi:hypothetical protein
MGILISCLVMYLAGIIGIKYIINDRDRRIDEILQKNQALENTNLKLLEKNCELVDKLNELESFHSLVKTLPFNRPGYLSRPLTDRNTF